jgi:hypothetical protein
MSVSEIPKIATEDSNFKINVKNSNKILNKDQCYKNIERKFCSNKKFCDKDNSIKIINQIVYTNLDVNTLSKAPLNVKNMVISNVIFITFLTYLKHYYNDNSINQLIDYNRLKKRQNINNKSTKIQPPIVKKNTNESSNLKNINIIFSYDTNDSFDSNKLTLPKIESLMKQIKSDKIEREKEDRETVSQNTVSSSNISSNISSTGDITVKDIEYTYKNLLDNFKQNSFNNDVIKDKLNQDRNFLIWFCKWNNMINHLYKIGTVIVDHIIPFIKTNLNKNSVQSSSNQKFYQERLDILLKIDNSNYKNSYPYVLILGELLFRLHIKNNKIYKDLLKITDINNNKAKIIDEKIGANDVLSAIIIQYKFFNRANELAYPSLDRYSNYPPIVKQSDGDCFSQSLNNVFFYRYLINLLNLTTNKYTSINDLLNENNNFIMVDINTLNIDQDSRKELLQILYPNLAGKIEQLLGQGKLKDKMFAWIDNRYGYLITVCYKMSGKQGATIKTIGHAQLKNDNFKLTENNKNSVLMKTTNIGKLIVTGKMIEINCDNKKIVIKRDIVDKNSGIYIKIDNKVLYYLILIDDKYQLLSSCGPTSTANNLLGIAEYSTNSDTNISQSLTIYTTKPDEVMMIFAIGYAIKFNPNFFKDISDKYNYKKVDC